jgi:hypothetical protein
LDRFVVLVDELVVARRIRRKNFGDWITRRNGLDLRQQEALCRIRLLESAASGWASISRLNATAAPRLKIKNFDPLAALGPPLSAGD